MLVEGSAWGCGGGWEGGFSEECPGSNQAKCLVSKSMSLIFFFSGEIVLWKVSLSRKFYQVSLSTWKIAFHR